MVWYEAFYPHYGCCFLRHCAPKYPPTQVHSRLSHSGRSHLVLTKHPLFPQPQFPAITSAHISQIASCFMSAHRRDTADQFTVRFPGGDSTQKVGAQKHGIFLVFSGWLEHPPVQSVRTGSMSKWWLGTRTVLSFALSPLDNIIILLYAACTTQS